MTPILQRGAGYGRPRAARAEQDYLGARDIGKAAPEAFGKPQAIGVVPDSFARGKNHCVDRADGAGVLRQFVQQRNDGLFCRGV